MATVPFSTGHGPGDLLVALMPLFRWGLRRLTRHRADAATSEGSPA